MLIVSIFLLILSFESSDNETLRLIGESKDHIVANNKKLDRKMANVLVVIAFFCVISGGLSIAASWSQEAVINYIYGYANLILMSLFAAVGLSIMIL